MAEASAVSSSVEVDKFVGLASHDEAVVVQEHPQEPAPKRL